MLPNLIFLQSIVIRILKEKNKKTVAQESGDPDIYLGRLPEMMKVLKWNK